ncbi:predicted protein [Scheffersomyces stipitis CBS 6054]|uniref:Ubiquitin-like protease family profile domain-containing protein n=1 Tax=Scheffersomyces stipitis (strain ATCC 58785 / CBS 6054 / NBRC 10063 / NRRL Y-11545) TaxID=322104 RepID=A3LPU8_PICST|nr:predicted protein [Scheffersomyces stipitis CBS 6054]ABN65102.2 predicted protein [Scheffersomyces stipitis CBS 6054]KAG2736514.1 hypothetical protein G9P44_000604 [Scheffersomyces stipitis]
MPHIVFDSAKGFCYDSSGAGPGRHSATRSNGFDQLPWDDYLPDEVDESEEETPGNDDDSSIHATRKKRLTKSEKKEQRQMKKINAARNKHIKRQQELSGSGKDRDMSELEIFNPFLAKSSIKSIHSNILRMAEQPKSIDFKLFQYHSIALYSSDLDHILPGEWLNDNNISLIFELINQLFLKSQDPAKKFNYQVQMLYPSLVQLFLHFPVTDDLENILPINELKQSKFIFIPINFIDDYEDIDLEDVNNGDHWALALLSILENRLYLYDSMAIDGDEFASQSETNLLNELIKRLKSCKSIFKAGDKTKIDIIRMKCDQQDNFDDCGVYLIMIACFLVKQLLFSDSAEGAVDLDIGNVRFNALSARLYMMKLIHKLYKSL